ncbi:MAG: vitamin B12 dependent-methionine synthase activation domain-containing protein, partial [Candidatus Binatia bacterium]
GKNIVGVVLGCNNYEVIDLGVMVSCDRILQEAADRKAHIIGLSGLITPSLDEMVHVAREMERSGLQLPLLIGGATTSRQHTAVKIAPEYGRPTVHVLDASRAVSTVSSLLSSEKRAGFDAENRKEQERLRTLFREKQARPLVPYAKAKEKRLAIEWRAEDLAKPAFLGTRALDDFPLGELVRYVDWTFFFHAWELRGKFPQILEHPEMGKAASDLYRDARKLLERIIREKRIIARGVYGFWPANAEDDDIVLFSDETRAHEVARFVCLRQQEAKTDTQESFKSLADFVAPVSSGLVDSVGGFALTAGIGADDLVREFESQHDNYGAIMVKALADRFAEAFAEALHERARRDWGYGTAERLTSEQLIGEEYRGIRPAFGYPACPEHSEKRTLFSLLGAEACGMELTEHFAMLPAASVSGIYLAHPKAHYFGLGRVDRD